MYDEGQEIIGMEGDPAAIESMQHDWDERVAICMVDGGCSLVESYTVALKQLQEQSDGVWKLRSD
jgi:uncharacterized protein